MDIFVNTQVNVRSDLCRLARFGANISDAHSCFIFLPAGLSHPDSFDGSKSLKVKTDLLEVGGYHSLSNDVISSAQLERGQGIIGWVAKHQKSIHVSPFEHDSRTLGIYKSDHELKSFIGIPIPLFPDQNEKAKLSGVIACDSKKSFAFSKLQGKLLDDLAAEISNTLQLSLLRSEQDESFSSWELFLERGEALVNALGRNSIELLRLQINNFETIEKEVGTTSCIGIVTQIFRLIQQALPPHCPFCKLPNGDSIILLDNMMSSFYQNKIQAICRHVGRNNPIIEFDFTKRSFAGKPKRDGSASVEELVYSTCFPENQQAALKNGEAYYDYRRA